MHFTPLIFENLDFAWSFSAELCPEGLIGIAGSVLRYVITRRHFDIGRSYDEEKGSEYPVYMPKISQRTNCSY
jgi:hypothetical protein